MKRTRAVNEQEEDPLPSDSKIFIVHSRIVNPGWDLYGNFLNNIKWKVHSKYYIYNSKEEAIQAATLLFFKEVDICFIKGVEATAKHEWNLSSMDKVTMKDIFDIWESGETIPPSKVKPFGPALVQVICFDLKKPKTDKRHKEIIYFLPCDANPKLEDGIKYKDTPVSTENPQIVLKTKRTRFEDSKSTIYLVCSRVFRPCWPSWGILITFFPLTRKVVSNHEIYYSKEEAINAAKHLFFKEIESSFVKGVPAVEDLKWEISNVDKVTVENITQMWQSHQESGDQSSDDQSSNNRDGETVSHMELLGPVLVQVIEFGLAKPRTAFHKRHKSVVYFLPCDANPYIEEKWLRGIRVKGPKSMC